VLDAWQRRSADQLPAASDIGAPARTAWSRALANPPKADDDRVDTVLLRVEIASEVPSPPQHMSARRLLQLQLLTRRNDPAPAQTWVQDVAELLSGAPTPERSQRLQSALRKLLG